MEDERGQETCWPEQRLDRQMEAFAETLRREDRSSGTIEKYVRDTRAFIRWLAKQELEISQEAGNEWKADLLQRGYSPATVNSMVCGVNSFFRSIGKPEIRIHAVRLQRKLFWEARRELNENDFRRLVSEARHEGKERLALVMETIAGTGIRVSELSYITVKAVMEGRAAVHLKGKVRVILLSKQVRERLKRYIRKRNIRTGCVFASRCGTPLSRKQIWAEMKALAKRTGVEGSKVFPHNLRHLFARRFYEENRDLAALSSLLGHSSVETTRIYLLTTETSHLRQLERLRLIC